MLTIHLVDLPEHADDPRWAARGALIRDLNRELLGTTEWDVDDASALVQARGDTEQAAWRFLALDGATPVGFASIFVHRHDSPDTGNVYVYVSPERRGQGIGSALAARLRDVVAEQGLTRLTAWVLAPVPGDGPRVGPPSGIGAAPADHPGISFALHQGLALEQIERVSRYDFAAPLVPPEDALEEATRVAGGDYELIVWEGQAPGDIVDDLARLKERMAIDTPSGGMEVVEERWDGARIRRMDERVLATMRFWRAVARHRATGEIVALSELVRDRGNANALVEQWDTIVLAGHRGHRLGTAVKAANLIQVRDTEPDATGVVTWNAEENRYMLDVNESLGFRPILVEAQFQRRL